MAYIGNWYQGPAINLAGTMAEIEDIMTNKTDVFELSVTFRTPEHWDEKTVYRKMLLFLSRDEIFKIYNFMRNQNDRA